MGNLKAKVIVLGLTHLAEDFRKLSFMPVDDKGNVKESATPFNIVVKGAKNDKDNFVEGGIYNLSITSEEAPAGDKNKTNTGKGKEKDDKKGNTPPAPPAPAPQDPPAPPAGNGEGNEGSGEEGQDPPAQTGSGEGQ